MERRKIGSKIINIDCFRQGECPLSPTSGDGTCEWLDRREIIVPVESCIDDWVSQLNSAEPLRKCELGYKRYRTGVVEGVG